MPYGFFLSHHPSSRPHPRKDLPGMRLMLHVSYVCTFSGLLTVGVKESAMVNKIFTCVNVLVLGFIVVSGFVKGSLKNWQFTEDYLHNNSGHLCSNKWVAPSARPSACGSWCVWGMELARTIRVFFSVMWLEYEHFWSDILRVFYWFKIRFIPLK